MELKITSISCYSSFGNIAVEAAGQKLSVELEREELQELSSLALTIFQRRQQALADAIASAQPALLMPPAVEDATYDEVY